MLMNKKKSLFIVTCCLDDWGGSEELWARSIPFLKDKGIKNITIFKNKFNLEHPEFVALRQQNITLKALEPTTGLFGSLFSKSTTLLKRLGHRLGIANYDWHEPAARLLKALKQQRPDLVLISQGINFDGLVFANQCLKLKIPYIIVSHKAVDFFWPQPGDRAYMKQTLLNAEKCLFVSHHNLKLTEEQFGVRLPNSSVILNPVKITPGMISYPPVHNGFKLACIGRLFIIDKGQDILLRVLAQQKWKERPLSITFYGKGPDEEGLKSLVELLNIDKVTFSGYHTDLEDIWKNHHALILPSRSEGLPLTIIEALYAGRMVIATNAGGNAEVIHNGTNGFIAAANEQDLDRILEIAWNKRQDWEAMGIKAYQDITEHIPAAPQGEFANLLNAYLNE